MFSQFSEYFFQVIVLPGNQTDGLSFKSVFSKQYVSNAGTPVSPFQ